MAEKEEITGESIEIQKYFGEIEEKLNYAYEVANKARKKGLDPEDHTDIPLAKDMAERVNGIMSAVAPQLTGPTIIKRIKELEKKYSALDWRVALVIADEVAAEKFCKFKSKLEAMEIGIKTGFTYHTQGIVSAPLEGFTELKLKKRRDGKEYFAAKFSGPIRGAGGTAAAVSLIIADYVRKRNGYAQYDPDENEVERYVVELEDYHERVTNLQYHGSPEEIAFLMKNCPVEVDGDPTEKMEVSKNKDIPRVETNKIRGGVALVVSMLALKAKKLWKELSKWGKEFELEDWNFLEEFLLIQKKANASESKKEDSAEKIVPNYTFISDLVAGRPVLTHPMAFGGFRLRYGRCRLSGYSAASIHPATMILLKKYIATGTQLKLERPGKAAAITPCDTIEGPIVKLADESVIQISTESEAKNRLPEVKEIIFLGDILISYGDFLDRNHILIPPGYTEEQYAREFENMTVNLFGSLDFEKLSSFTELPSEMLKKISEQLFRPEPGEAIIISEKTGMPLHPAYTHYWKALSKSDISRMVEWFSLAEFRNGEGSAKRIVLPLKKDEKRILESIGLPHALATEYVIIEGNEEEILMRIFPILQKKRSGLDFDSEISPEVKRELEIICSSESALDAVNRISGLKIRDKAGIFIGARMGRPEKAKMRQLTGSPHT
ncbi:MAG: hypothetical protein NTV63_02615, partial [Candidatus Woesearchaeota archaeon]|nr:hypothetical protein [Candidatus Woesearchaeota archaeon]